MAKNITRRDFIKHSSRMAAFAGLGSCGILNSGCRSKQEFDLLIKGGRVYDGLGHEAIETDIGIVGDKIVKLGRIPSSQAREIIDARNLSVCPGFIDSHDHSDVNLFVNAKAESHVRQGITSVVSGNCGASPFPVSDEVFEESQAALKEAYNLDLTWRDIKGFLARLEESGIALNYSTFVGQGTIRGAAMGFNDRSPKPEELEKMKQYVVESIRGGALGLSTGLEYAPGSFAQPEEITELCRVAVANGGMYSSHMRDEGDLLMEALDETINVARETGASLQISHFKIAYPRNWHKVDDALAKVEEADQQGISIFCDRYPYVAGSTGFSSFNFPLWALQGTTDEFLARLKDPTLESRLREYVDEREKKLGSWDKVVISYVATEKNKMYEGRSVLDGMKDTDKDAFEFMRDLMIEEKNRAGQIIFMSSEENLKKILSHPLVGIGCDGSALAPYGPLGQGKPHPRSYGTFPRVLAKYVREEKILPMPEMLKKMTSVPAQKFGFSGRGILQDGFFADIVVFDEDRVQDMATFKEPHQYPEGINYVLVNGKLVVKQGDHTGQLPGRILRYSRT